MNEIIIGIDPGLHTGFALLDPTGLQTWTLKPMSACDKLHQLAYREKSLPIRVSIERFTFQSASSKKTRQNDAIEVIGAVRWICHLYDIPFVVVGASDAARIGTHETLQQLGWWVEGAPDHIHRAVAQVAHAFMQRHPDDFERALSSGTI